MNLYLPKYAVRRTLNWFWNQIRREPVARLISHESQAPLAYDLARLPNRQMGLDLGLGLFDRPLCGAGYAYESRRWITPVSQAAIATTGNNTVNFNIYDYCSVSIIGFYWTVTGTVTAMVMDFDLYAGLNADTLSTDKLNGVDGILTGYAVGDMTKAKAWYADLGHNPGEIDLSPGQSVQAIVTTTTTAGNGMPFCVGYARSEDFRNLTGAVRKPGT